MIGTRGGQKRDQGDLFFRGRAAIDAHLAGFGDFIGAGVLLAGPQDLVRHVCVGPAGRHAVDLHVVAADFLGHALDEACNGCLGGGIDREIRPGMAGAAADDDDDLAGALLHQARQHGAHRIHHSEKVDIQGFGPLFGPVGKQRANGPEHAGRGHQAVDAAEHHLHPIHGGHQLFQVAHVGAQPQGVAAGLLDFELGQVEFRLAPGQQPHAGSGLRQPQRETLTDAPPRPGDQDAFVTNVAQDEFVHAGVPTQL